MGLKCQLVFNMDTQKLFIFTVGDGHSIYVNLNFLCRVFKKMWISRFAFRRLSGNHMNKAFDIFSRPCNILSKFMSVEWWLLVILRSGKTLNKSHRSMLNSNGISIEPCGTPKMISNNEPYVPFNFTLCFRLVKYECNSFKEGISTP